MQFTEYSSVIGCFIGVFLTFLLYTPSKEWPMCSRTAHDRRCRVAINFCEGAFFQLLLGYSYLTFFRKITLNCVYDLY